MIKKILMLTVAAGLAAGAPANAADKILIGQSAGINTVPSLVAMHEGFFKQQGLDVELKPLARGGLAIEGLSSGTLQFAEIRTCAVHGRGVARRAAGRSRRRRARLLRKIGR